VSSASGVRNSNIEKLQQQPVSPDGETIISPSDGGGVTISDDCKSHQLKVTMQKVSFPESSGSCKDGRGADWLDQIKYEPQKLSMSGYRKICSISMSIPGTNFMYDDEFALTLNDVILASSYYPRPSGLKTLPKFDFSYLSASKYQWRTGSIPYCASIAGDSKSEGRCVIPTAKGATSIKKGTLDIKLSESTSASIMGDFSAGAEPELKMITYGNGVTVGKAGDCYHSAFDLEVSVSYLP
jgi:hypothetical protein